jgi:hypothetical protein
MPTIMPLWADRPLLAALASISSPARSALEESVGGLRKIGQTEPFLSRLECIQCTRLHTDYCTKVLRSGHSKPKLDIR